MSMTTSGNTCARSVGKVRAGGGLAIIQKGQQAKWEFGGRPDLSHLLKKDKTQRI